VDFPTMGDRKELVHEYGVADRTIGDVLNNKSWTWVV